MAKDFQFCKLFYVIILFLKRKRRRLKYMNKEIISVLLVFTMLSVGGSSLASANPSDQKAKTSDNQNKLIYDAGFKTPDGNEIKIFNPGKSRASITMYDNIVYSKVEAPLKNQAVDLKMSIVAKLGNSEMKNATGSSDPNDVVNKKPVIIYLNGGGFRGADKNQMVPEMQYLAESGYAIAFVYYRSSAEAVFPAQIIDVKSAVRYLRANAKKYGINPDKIGITGRSAGGSLVALACMNLPGYDEGDNLEYSSDVQFGVDMFGPVDFKALMDFDRSNFSPTSRWKKDADTHSGAYLGGSYENMPERFREASAVFQVNSRSAPMLILHGDADPLVPYSQSIEMYDAMKAAGKEVDFYLVKGAGHGTDEFWQESTRTLCLKYFDKYLKNK
jgi:acetyl esterase/lipase